MAAVSQILEKGRFNSLTVSLAHDDNDVRQCQALRYRVFGEEMGAQLSGDGLDVDYFDAHCRHLLVRDSVTQRIVGTTRILLDEDAFQAGSFYSQSEFDMTQVLALPGRFMEIGRTCIDAEYRTGAALGLMWRGVLSLMDLHKIDYVMGCASIPFGDTGRYAMSVFQHLQQKHYAAEYLRVYPKVSLPRECAPSSLDVVMPPLVRAYLRLGASVCGELHWDMAFNVADALMFIDRDHLNTRYLNRFLCRQ